MAGVLAIIIIIIAFRIITKQQYKKLEVEVLLASGDNRHSGSGEKRQFWSNENRHLQIE